MVVAQVYDDAVKEFEYRGCYMLTAEEAVRVGDFCLPINPKTGMRGLNPAAVGQPARVIAEKSNVTVPADHPCKVLIGEGKEIGHTHAMCLEKLAPVLGLFKAKDFQEALEIAKNCIHLAGKGHTASIHTAYEAQDRINQFSQTI